MKKNSRQILIAILTFLSGLYFFLEWLLPEKMVLNSEVYEFGKYHEHISNGFVTVGAMAIGLGLINIVRVHGGAIVKGRKGFLNSIGLLLGIIIMFVVEGGDFLTSLDKVDSWSRVSNLTAYSKDIYDKKAEIDPLSRLDAQQALLAELKKELNSRKSYLSASEVEKPKLFNEASNSLIELEKQTANLKNLYQSNAPDYEVKKAHQDLELAITPATLAVKEIADNNYDENIIVKLKKLMENGFFFPLGAAMFSLLAFYIAVAAYRSFRIKSVEALVMMIFAILVMLGQIPQGPLYIWEGLPALRLWLMSNVSTPAVRAIEFGSIIAGLAMAMRMWLSLEKSPLAVDSEEG